jgi:hypothetical protein
MGGRSRSVMPGGWWRRGPVKGRGEARRENIGSVMRLRPPVCSSTVECPVQVTVCRVRLACSSATSGATGQRSNRRRAGRRLRSEFALQACQLLLRGWDTGMIVAEADRSVMALRRVEVRVTRLRPRQHAHQTQY